MPVPLLLPLLLLLPPAPASPPARTPAPAARSAAPRTPLRIELHLTRADLPTATGATPDASAATPPPAATTPAPAPTILATPILSTVDQSTATISVTNPDFGFALALSPTLENTENTDTASILALWNLRLSGRSLPGGTNVVTTTGSTRVPLGAAGETVLAEVPLRDPKTGTTSLFRLTARVTVPPLSAASRAPATDNSVVAR